MMINSILANVFGDWKNTMCLKTQHENDRELLSYIDNTYIL